MVRSVDDVWWCGFGGVEDGKKEASVQIQGCVEFLQVQVNSYGAGSYEDFVLKDSRLFI